jgi:hypothetical protein
MRGGMEQYLTPMGPTKLHVNPIFEISPLEPRFSEWLVFEGLSVDESGRQHYLDATVAFKRAILNCIDYLSKFGYTKEQVGALSTVLMKSVMTGSENASHTNMKQIKLKSVHGADTMSFVADIHCAACLSALLSYQHKSESC